VIKDILIVYQQIPESTDVFFVSMSDYEFKLFSRIDRKYTNTGEMSTDDLKTADQLYKLLFTDYDTDTRGKWADLKVENATTLRSDGLIVTGIVL
jgi:hypothetical protein